MRRLGQGPCGNDDVARELNLHLRTLHRRLRTEGTSFHGVKDGLRRDLARYYLEQTGLPVSLVSEKLGFTEQSVLTRCCQRWFGCAPTAYRKGQRLNP